MRDDILYWIWLSLTSMPGSMISGRLLSYFGSPEEIYRADEVAFSGTPLELSPDTLKPFLNKNLKSAERIAEYCEKNRIGIMTFSDPFYPPRLGMLQNRPILLYYIGSFVDFDTVPCVSVVGMRRMSEYGRVCADKISYDLAKKGVCIVSGMAKGIDGAAHGGALRAKGKTIAVMGSGLDVVYPSENRALYERICSEGLVISEFAPGTPPNGRNFPIRNRIISGISSAVIVVEAAEKSGSLITAEYAIRQRKLLFAIPGKITDENSKGTNRLIAIGARACTCADDVLQPLEKEFKSAAGVGSIPLRPREKAYDKGVDKASEKAEFTFEGKRRAEAVEGTGENIVPPGFFAEDKTPLFDKGEGESVIKREKEETGLFDRREDKKTEVKETAGESSHGNIKDFSAGTLERPGEFMKLSDNERALYLYLTGDPVFGAPCFIDDIECGLTPAELRSAVTMLEIKGLAEHSGVGKIKAI